MHVAHTRDGLLRDTSVLLRDEARLVGRRCVRVFRALRDGERVVGDLRHRNRLGWNGLGLDLHLGFGLVARGLLLLCDALLGLLCGGGWRFGLRCVRLFDRLVRERRQLELDGRALLFLGRVQQRLGQHAKYLVDRQVNAQRRQ
jgi:hypothetical protein